MYTYKWSERDRTIKLSLNNSRLSFVFIRPVDLGSDIWVQDKLRMFVMDVSRVY